MGADVLIDSEASVVISSISRPGPPTQPFGGAHKDIIGCVRVFIGVGVCACI